MAKKSLLFEDLKQRYTDLWDSCKIRPERKDEAKKLVDIMLSNKERYGHVEAHTKVAWPIIAALHNKESSMRFTRNLHNGQPLNMITTIVPKGRGPFHNWEESAIDALNMKKSLISKLNLEDAWQIEECLWFAESYNGWGYYLYRNINSPYLWAGTNKYDKGGYPKDNTFDANYIIKNLGIAAVFKTLEEMGELDLDLITNGEGHQIFVSR